MKIRLATRPSSSGNIIDFHLPKSWSDLTQEQLKYVALVLTMFDAVHAKTYIFLRFTGIKVIRKNSRGWLCSYRLNWRKKFRFILADWQVHSFLDNLKFIEEPSHVPIQLKQIGYRTAISANLHGLTFQDYLICENLYQGYLYTQNLSHIRDMVPFLYHDNRPWFKRFFLRHRFRDYELTSIFLWWMSAKNYLASSFPHFFQPFSQGDGDSLSPDLMAAMNAQIRALTKGDITKEQQVLNMDCWRALTELDAKAREAQELKEKQHGK